MKISFQIILIFSILLTAGSYSQAAEYRGVAPFRSTRADVVRLLGAPVDENEFRAKYESEKELIYVVYASSVDVNYHKCAKQLSPDTVMLINVNPKTKTVLSDLKLDERDFERIDQPYFKSETLFNKVEGIYLLRNYEGEIGHIKHVAAESNKHLCTTFQDTPESSLYLLHLPDEVTGKQRISELQLHLDSFYSQVADDPSVVGVIVNFGTDKEVSRRTAIIKRIIKTRKYDVRRLRIVNGGRYVGFITRFFVVPSEAAEEIPGKYNIYPNPTPPIS